MRALIGVVMVGAIVAQAGLKTRLYGHEGIRLHAHEKFKIVGSVAGLKKDEIAIKAIDGATYEIDMNDGTVVTDKHHKKIDPVRLKVGVSVVVLALGHDMFDLEAFEIQLVDR